MGIDNREAKIFAGTRLAFGWTVILLAGCGTAPSAVSAGDAGPTTAPSPSGSASPGMAVDAAPPAAPSPPEDAAPPDDAGDGGSGDVYGPWAGGAAYYAQFSNGPPSDPSFFPISVWLQDPSLAAQYQAIGINQFIGLWQGPTEAQMQALDAAGMPVACTQDLTDVTDKTIFAWQQQDEPDNAQPVDGGYGPCVPASAIVSEYGAWRSADATRPVFLNLGEGVANDAWVGRGVCTGTSDYPTYAMGADILSFDIYPVNSGLDITLVAKGVDNLTGWSNDRKPVWDWIECTGIDAPSGKPTPDQVKAEVWMSIIHGAMGIGYFVHQLAPTADDHALLDDPTMSAAVGMYNQQIKALAPVLNTPPITNAATVASSVAASPVDVLVKRQGGYLYVFAVSMGAAATAATVTLAAGTATTVQVIGEGRQIAITSGVFQDAFDGYAVHLYQVQ